MDDISETLKILRKISQELAKTISFDAIQKMQRPAGI